MSNSTHVSNLSVRTVLVAGLLLGALAVASAPMSAHAATYGFITSGGYVSTVSADSPAAAMATGLNISLGSGVILFDSAADNAMVGYHVAGM